MGISNIDDIVAYISYVLSSNKYQTYSEDELVQLTLEGVSSPRPRIVTCIQSLVAGGFCNGRLARSKAVGISFKEGGPQGTPYTPPDQYLADRPEQEHTENGMSDVERAKLERMIADLQAKADEAFEDLLTKQQELNQAKSDIEEKDQEVADLRNELKDAAKNVKVIEIREKGKKTKKVEGIFHEAFPELLTLAGARKNIFLYGPTGCGKSHNCSQAAEALGLNFAFISFSAGTSEGAVVGKQLPMVSEKEILASYRRLVKQKIDSQSAATLAAAIGSGFNYVISEFVRVYENGGLFLLDEIDAADANVLLTINAALANGKMAVPNRPDQPYAYRHDDFVCAAAANTIGLGADRMYSGRNRLDDSTMDRFRIGTIMMDYDANIERHLCQDDELRERLWKIRYNVRNARLERCVSTRFLIDAHQMKSECGWTHERIEKSLFNGWKDSEIAKATQN